MLTRTGANKHKNGRHHSLVRNECTVSLEALRYQCHSKTPRPDLGHVSPVMLSAETDKNARSRLRLTRPLLHRLYNVYCSVSRAFLAVSWFGDVIDHLRPPDVTYIRRTQARRLQDVIAY
jgi:hypothetical protein